MPCSLTTGCSGSHVSVGAAAAERKRRIRPLLLFTIVLDELGLSQNCFYRIDSACRLPIEYVNCTHNDEDNIVQYWGDRACRLLVAFIDRRFRPIIFDDFITIVISSTLYTNFRILISISITKNMHVDGEKKNCAPMAVGHAGFHFTLIIAAYACTHYHPFCNSFSFFSLSCSLAFSIQTEVDRNMIGNWFWWIWWRMAKEPVQNGW